MMAGLPVKSLTVVVEVFHPFNRVQLAKPILLLASFLSFPLALIADDSVPIRAPEHIEGVTKVDAEGMVKLFNTIPNLPIIDSRLTTNRSFGYIEGSINLPDTETNCQSLAKVLPDKKQSALFYCNGPKCGRSAVAINVAKECGYSNLYWFRGGIEEWRQKGYPLLK